LYSFWIEMKSCINRMVPEKDTMAKVVVNLINTKN